jgi:hypothetical protein
METPSITMAYRCPLKINDLQDDKLGKYCTHCAKHIPDMSQRTDAEILASIQQANGNFCGTFNAYKLKNPYGNWRDHLVHFYQKIRERKKRIRWASVLLIGLLAVTGCRRRTSGYPYYSYRGTPVLRVHPKSLIEFAEAPDEVKFQIYQIKIKASKKKPIKKRIKK